MNQEINCPPLCQHCWSLHHADQQCRVNPPTARSEEFARLLAEAAHIEIVPDGNMLCAHFDDFINLAESPAGFGKTEADAIAALWVADGAPARILPHLDTGPA